MGNLLQQRKTLHKKIYLISLIGITVSILLSRFMLSVFQIVLILNYIIEGDFKKKLARLKENKAWIFSSIILLTFIGAWNTESENLHLILNQIRTKLPLIHIPLIIASSEKLSKKEIIVIMLFFIAASFISTLFSLLIYLNVLNHGYGDYRSFSYFIFHIYFATFLLFSIYFIYVYWHNTSLKTSEKIMLILLSAWLFFFLILMKAFTSFIALMCLLVWLLYNIRNKNKHAKPIILLTLVLFVGGATYIGSRLKQDFTPKKIDITTLDKQTKSGNIYYHEKSPTQIENGHYINIYFCEKELKNTWNKVSNIPYDYIDKKNQRIKHTLIRYLTSQGKRKDKEGVLSLSEKDIKNIENGIANYLYADKLSLYARIHAEFWGMNEYLKNGDPNGKSLATRFEAAKTGLDIIKNNFWWGVGSGDLKDSFFRQYTENNSLLKDKYVLGHNTFINVFVQAGVFGFMWFLFAFFYPIFVNKGWNKPTFNVFFIILMVIFVSSGGLLHQTEITFTVFFYSLFLFGINKTDYI